MSRHARLLLVEANADDAELMRGALEEGGLGAAVDVVRDGDAALAYLEACERDPGAPRRLPAAVLLDLKLQKRDGLEVVAAIRARPRLCHLPVVVFTASREPHDIRRSYEAGANAYVVKPVAYADWAAALRDIGRFWLGRNEVPVE